MIIHPVDNDPLSTSVELHLASSRALDHSAKFGGICASRLQKTPASSSLKACQRCNDSGSILPWAITCPLACQTFSPRQSGTRWLKAIYRARTLKALTTLLRRLIGCSQASRVRPRSFLLPLEGHGPRSRRLFALVILVAVYRLCPMAPITSHDTSDRRQTYLTPSTRS
ncbi:hypothetical protein BC567DRAFT_46340 [Phyllosticta citribraziliensis]